MSPDRPTLVDDELLDLVDENNIPTGVQRRRAIVHIERTDWHRTTHIWIVNGKGEILCQQRSLTKDANPGLWQSFFGGHVKAGEIYEQSALEELNGELGITASAADLVPLYVKKGEAHKHFGQVYVLRWDGDPASLRFNDGEVAEVKWIAFEELKQSIESGSFCNSLDEKVMEYVGGNAR